MSEKKIKKTQVLKSLIDGVNIYTGAEIEGLDENLKKDLTYILEYLLKHSKANTTENDTQQEKQVVAVEDKRDEIVLRRGKITVDGQKYSLAEGAVFDSTGMRIPDARSGTILYKYYSKIDREKLDEEQLLECIKGIKYAKCLKLCTDVIQEELEKEHSYSFIRAILPIYTSSLRELKKSKEAISFWNDNENYYYAYESSALYTSLASAYCDIKDYVNARKFANRAYAMSGGGSGHKNELSLVYMRIKREAGED